MKRAKKWVARHRDGLLLILVVIVFIVAMWLEEPIDIPVEDVGVIPYEGIHAKETEDATEEATEVVTVEPSDTITVTEPEGTEEELPKLTSLGEFKLTAYCSCEKCCGKWAKDRPKDENGNDIVIGSEGTVLEPLGSIAVDTSVIPYGTKIMIYDRVFVAQDTGKSIVGNCIDVYFGSDERNHEEADIFGVQYAEVFLVEE